ncbi:ParB/RepB/Spo0J family partition protein, partial [bacterium]|nr:ParB/RepB/Spo0J family partition protein [bacterium]
MNPKNNRVLGRGLSALIQGADAPRLAPRGGQDLDGREAMMVELSAIGLNPSQPRKIFKDNSLQELADSIRQVGVLQPVLVRHLLPEEPKPLRLSQRLDSGSQADGPEPAYCLVAGERRVRAAAMAGVSRIPAIVCSYEETEALKVALLENIQRENLNPVEEAVAYQQLLDGYGATQEELAVMLGKSRSGVANTLRLLSLETEIQDMLQEDQISRGHAKVLLGLDDSESRLRLARLCRSRGLSVRECESRVQAQLTGAGGAPRRSRRKRQLEGETREVKALRERPETTLGTPVQI